MGHVACMGGGNKIKVYLKGKGQEILDGFFLLKMKSIGWLL